MLIRRRDDERGRTSEEFSGFRSVSYRPSPEGSLHTPSASFVGLAPVGEKSAPVVSGDTGASAAQCAAVIDMILFERASAQGWISMLSRNTHPFVGQDGRDDDRTEVVLPGRTCCHDSVRVSSVVL